MRTRFSLLLLSVLIPAVPAHADDHRADLYGAVSYAEGSTLFGFQQSIGLAMKPGTPWSVLGDFGVHFGSPDRKSVTRVTYLVGPRRTLRFTAAHKIHAHFLIGGVRTTGSKGKRNKGTNEFAFAYGAAFESFPEAFPGNAGVQVDNRRWGYRVLADGVDGGDDSLRLSAGITYRFPAQ